MTATLRVVLDQVVSPADPDLTAASAELARALVEAAPSGCDVSAIVPAAAPAALEDLAREVPGLVDTHKAALARRELATAWQLGVAPGIGGGMIHSPTLFAPLVKHDRVHTSDQTVVTLWDLRAWDAPDELPRAAVLWQKAMLKRAVRFADAVVVPTHSMAERLSEIARLGDRIRVIAGAAPTGFRAPSDSPARLRELGLPHRFVALAGGKATSDGLLAGLHAVALAGAEDIVVIDAPEGEEPAIADIASAAGVPEARVHVRGALDAADRGAVLGAAAAFVAPARQNALPWRVLEAMAVGVPIVAADSAVHAEVLADVGVVEEGGLVAALRAVLGSDAARERGRVLALDRARAFSWQGAAERVWQLHAEL